MALTIEVSKVSVTEQLKDLWNITLNLRCLDGLVEVINRNFSTRYRRGDDIEDKEQALRIQMQQAIDTYKSEQQIFAHEKLQTVVTNLQANLVG